MGNFFKEVKTDSSSILEGRYLSFAILNISSAVHNLRGGFKFIQNIGFYVSIFMLTVIDVFCYSFILYWFRKKLHKNILFMITWPCGYLTNFKYLRKFVTWAQAYINLRGLYRKRLFRRLKKRFFTMNVTKRPPSMIVATKLEFKRTIQAECNKTGIVLMSLFDSDLTGNPGGEYILPSNDDSLPLSYLLIMSSCSAYFLGNLDRRLFFSKKILSLRKKKYLKKPKKEKDNVSSKLSSLEKLNLEKKKKKIRSRYLSLIYANKWLNIFSNLWSLKKKNKKIKPKYNRNIKRKKKNK